MVNQKARIQELRRRREVVGITQKALARRLLVTTHSVWRWEGGDEPPHEFVIQGWEKTIKELEQDKIKELEGNQ